MLRRWHLNVHNLALLTVGVVAAAACHRLLAAADDAVTAVQQRRQVHPLPIAAEPPIPFELTGVVTDDAGNGLAGATLMFDFVASATPGTLMSQAFAVTNAAGAYKIRLVAAAGAMKGPIGTEHAIAIGYVFAADCDNVPAACAYEYDTRYVLATTSSLVQNFRLHPITRIAAGDATLVTVSSDDAICSNNVQDMHPWPTEFVCRTVRIPVDADGTVAVEAIPVAAGAPLPGLEVEVRGGSSPCCSERLANPASVAVTAGSEVLVSVEIPWASGDQAFVVRTSFAPR